jgi:hypothetical protein
MINDKRVVYCLKLWVKEIQISTSLDDSSDYVRWIVNTCNNGILNGTYCSDDEYNEYLLTGEV